MGREDDRTCRIKKKAALFSIRGFRTSAPFQIGNRRTSLSFRVTARLAPRKERKGPMRAGFEASEQQGETYILTGEKTVQLQRAEKAIPRRLCLRVTLPQRKSATYWPEMMVSRPSRSGSLRRSARKEGYENPRRPAAPGPRCADRCVCSWRVLAALTVRCSPRKGTCRSWWCRKTAFVV